MSKFNRKFYEEYLKSEKWKEKRKEIYILRNKKCEICKCKLYGHYHIHHKTYKRLGEERNSDLILLCEKCHINIHKEIKQKNNKKIKDLKFYSCPFCLNKININKFLNTGKIRCPFCNSFINRLDMIKQIEISKKR